MSLHSLIKTVFYRLGFSIKRLRPVTPKTGATGRAHKAEEIRGMLHAVDPYAGFDAAQWPLDLQGWGHESAAFRELVQAVRPKLIVEVGTWKGASAIRMAEEVATAGLDAQILCVDTWLGALEFWTAQEDPERYESLKLKHGWPQVYYQFLANVCHKRHQQRVIPFPQTSATSALWLRYFGFHAELIYLDASHEEDDVYGDLLAYWEVLAPGGVLFGDDWSWDGVRLAVLRFAREVGVTYRFSADKWVLDKPGRTPE
jgi:hypothetical protein